MKKRGRNSRVRCGPQASADTSPSLLPGAEAWKSVALLSDSSLFPVSAQMIPPERSGQALPGAKVPRSLQVGGLIV